MLTTDLIGATLDFIYPDSTCNVRGICRAVVFDRDQYEAPRFTFLVERADGTLARSRGARVCVVRE
jgi:hypothetical protein